MRIVIALILTLLPLVSAARVGPDVARYHGQDLKWEKGARDFFVMFASLIERTDGSLDTGPDNPQADSCKDPAVGSGYTLTAEQLPPDAVVEYAFLVWMAVDDPLALHHPTDHTARLSFTHAEKPELTLSQEFAAGEPGTLSSIVLPDFSFEGVITRTPMGIDGGIHTYRMEITDFFEEIRRRAAADHDLIEPSAALPGRYTVSDIDCSEAPPYLASTGLMAGWAIVMIYRSEMLRAKNIYFYTGLSVYRFETEELMIGGFELPADALVRLTFFVGEGDPGLYTDTDPNREGLQLHGPISFAEPWIPLYNECNPAVDDHYEIYNSISSHYRWDAEEPVCIGDTVTKELEYAMDVDTFLIPTAVEPFSRHLRKGDTALWLRIGANQDQVYPNFLILSVDTRPPDFDIPAHPRVPSGREKDICTCAPDGDRFCSDRPFYYTIRVENWGDNAAYAVAVQDTLSPYLDYIAGSTEIATLFDAAGNGLNWKTVPDRSGGAFPFTESQQIAVQLRPCDRTLMTCEDAVRIRFRVQPKKGIPKNQIILNTAIITDDTGLLYRSNTSVPILLLPSTACPPVAQCPQPPAESCGGVRTDGCADDNDCAPGKECVEHECVDTVLPEKPLSNGARIEFSLGPYSPAGELLVAAPADDIVIGQLSLLAKAAGQEGKFFSLDEVSLSLTRERSDIALAAFRLIHDRNGDGRPDPDEPILAERPLPDGDTALFILSGDTALLPVNTEQRILILASAAYNGATIPANARFNGAIAGASALTARDAGPLLVKENTVPFAPYLFDPSAGHFIFTQALTAPPTPDPAAIAGEHELLRIRAKATDRATALSTILLQTPAGKTLFGAGITALALYEQVDGEQTRVVTSGTLKKESDRYRFDRLEERLPFAKGRERILSVRATLALQEKEKARIEIPRTAVTLTDGSLKILGLPIVSAELSCTGEYCAERPPATGDTGCGCSLVE